ncbi:MAG: ATP-dependent chaperone ClpB, partial [Pseudomonadota bacterium]
AEPQVMEMVRASFRPEFLNRLDEIILFERLSRGHMAGIVKIQIAGLMKRLEPRKITLDLDEDALAWLSAKGYDPAYGARPLKRVIQKSLQDPLAEMLLDGSLKDGDRLAVGADGDELLLGEHARPRAAVVH